MSDEFDGREDAAAWNDEPLPGFEPPEEPEVPEAVQRLQALLQSNSELIGELVRLRGQGFIPTLQLQLLDLRLNVVLEFLLEAIGEARRLNVAWVYESHAKEFLEEQVSGARKAALQI